MLSSFVTYCITRIYDFVMSISDSKIITHGLYRVINFLVETVIFSNMIQIPIGKPIGYKQGLRVSLNFTACEIIIGIILGIFLMCWKLTSPFRR